MTRLHVLAALLPAAVLALTAPTALAQTRAPLTPLGGDGPVVRIEMEGMVDTGLARYVDRAVGEAEDAGAAALVIRMDTYGGLLDAGDAIRTRLLDTDVPVVVVVDPNAASAGALIAYAADTIIMTPGASIGAATAVDGTGEAASEKVQSYTRGLMRTTAEATGRDPRLAEAMVDERIAIPGLTEPGQLLTLSADEALRVGLAAAVLPSADAAVEALGLADNEAVDHRATLTERILRVLSSPAVASVLLMLMLGGLYFELQSPGVGLPGIVAVVGAALFFAPHYLVGLVESWEIALFVVGLALIVAEIFVLPGFGVLGIAGIAAVVGALVAALIPNAGLVAPSQAEILRATGTLGAGVVLAVVAGTFVARWMPKSRAMGRLTLADTLGSAAGYTSAATDAGLVGQRGTAVTVLRPAGTAEFGGRRVDVVAQGPMVAAGAPVEVVSARGSRVEVREVPAVPGPAPAAGDAVAGDAPEAAAA